MNKNVCTDFVALEDLFGDELGDDETEGDEDAAAAVRNTADSYTWESGFTATWAQRGDGADANKGRCILYTQHDKDGRVEEIKQLFVDADKRLRRPYMDTFKYQPDQFLQQQKASKSIIRSMVILLDYSDAMKEPDLKPNRIGCVHSILVDFTSEFFKVGPMSQIAMFAMTNQDALLLSTLTGNPSTLKTSMEALGKADSEPAGDPSVQAALERALRLLGASPKHAAQEILIIFGSCLTNDSGDISSTIEHLTKLRIVVSVVSLSPEVNVLKRLANDTGGSFVVCLNRVHLREAIFAHTVPTTLCSKDEEKPQSIGTSLVSMGFPSLNTMTTVSLCVCHNRLGFDGYCCPRCQMRSCSLPATCKACDLVLVSAVDVARCQAVTSVPPPFLPLPAGDGVCFLCVRKFVSGGGQCPACHGFVCFECDMLIHLKLNFCPNCHKNELFLRQQFSLQEPRPPAILPPQSFPDSAFLHKVAQIYAKHKIIVL